MPIIYTPWDWYWIIGGDEANVWSSRRAAFVPVSDQDYGSWLIANNPGRFETMAELEALLAEQYPPGTLNTYTRFKRWQKETGGVMTSLGFPIKTDDRSQAKINGARLAAEANQVQSTIWHAADGTLHTVNDAAIQTMSNELQRHVDQCFDISADCLNQIAAGTITTREQIDTAFDAINPLVPPPDEKK
jgi:uncharacterized protein DUF4376